MRCSRASSRSICRTRGSPARARRPRPTSERWDTKPDPMRGDRMSPPTLANTRQGSPVKRRGVSPGAASENLDRPRVSKYLWCVFLEGRRFSKFLLIAALLFSVAAVLVHRCEITDFAHDEA